MIRRSPSPWVSLFLVVVVASLICAHLAAQNTPTVTHSSINVPFTPGSLPVGAPPHAIHERFATFRAGQFNSVLLLQNFRSDATVTITPALILQEGELSLDPVTLKPHSSTTVDINAFLQAHGLSDTFGTAVMRYTFSPYDGVSGVVLSSDEVHHLYVNSYTQSPEEYWQGTSYDATLWAPDEGTKGSISIINTSDEARTVDVSFQIKGHTEEQPTITIPARHTHTLNIDDLVARSRETGAGIHVEYSEYPGTILVEGHLINEHTGFEKYIHFLDKTLHYPNGAVRTQFLLLGQQPAEDGFPTGISFRSVAVVRNIDPAPVQVTPTLKYERNSAPQSVALTPLKLDVGETRVIDLSKLQKAGLIPADFHQGSLKLDPNTDHASIVAELFDFNDQTGGYTIGPMFFAYPGRATQSVWRTDGNFQTTIMIENTAAQDDVVTVQLFSDSGTYSKTFPITAGNLLKINLKQLQQENVPDDNGNPLTEAYGTISVAGKNGHLSKLSVDKLIHNDVDSDYVGLPSGPGACVGLTDASLFLSGSQSPYSVWEEDDWSDGTIEDFPSIGATSGNTSALQIWSTASGDMANTFPWGTTTNTIAFFGTPVSRMDCPACSVDPYTPSGLVNVPPMPTIACTPASLTRAQSSTCAVTASGTATYSGWKFTDGTNTVTSGTTAASWGGAIVTSGTVSVNVSVNGTAAVPLSARLTANPRTGFQFSAVNPTQIFSNTITCYDGSVHTAPSPPAPLSIEGFSCADMAYSFQFATVGDGGPNNGYEYVTSASNISGSQPTKYEFFVVSDLLSSSNFFVHQCGTFSASNTSGIIAGSQLKLNVFDHEQGSVLSHWTEYRDAQNTSTNNIGTVLEAAIGSPGSTGNSFAQTPGDAALARIAQASMVEPCGGFVNNDSSQGCKTCGAINYSPYQSCGTAQPMPFCQ